MNDIPDIDIDVANQVEAIATLVTGVRAALHDKNENVLKPHPSGVYFQQIPVNPLNGLAAFSHEHAEELGFGKFDLLSNSVYRYIATQDELRRLMDEPIDWEWFKNAAFVANLHQLHGWADMVVEYAPRSILDLACLLAIIRPAKKYLIGESWEVVRQKIWIKEPVPEHGAPKRYFKKSHAVAYALLVAVDARMKARWFFDTITLEERK